MALKIAIQVCILPGCSEQIKEPDVSREGSRLLPQGAGGDVLPPAGWSGWEAQEHSLPQPQQLCIAALSTGWFSGLNELKWIAPGT